MYPEALPEQRKAALAMCLTADSVGIYIGHLFPNVLFRNTTVDLTDHTTLHPELLEHGDRNVSTERTTLNKKRYLP